MRFIFWLSFKYLFKNQRRHINFIALISCLGIALGVSSLIVVLAVMNGFDQNLREKLLRFNFHITAFNNSTEISTKQIIDLEHVENAVIFSQIQTAIKKEESITPVIFQSIEFNPEEAALWKQKLSQGNFDSLAIGNILARNLGLGPGDTIEIFNPQDLKTHKFEVSGIFNFGIYDLDSTFIVSSLQYARDFLNKANPALAVGIRIDDIDKAGDVKTDIIGKFPGRLYLVQTWAEQNKTLFSALKLEKLTMFVILSLIILVASFNIFATQTVNVVEKIKDIGILKSIGLRKRAVGLLFCMQGIILGITGIIAGAGTGIGLCMLLKKYHLIKLPAKIYYIDYLPILMDYKDVIGVCCVAFSMSILFSLIPAVNAARIKTIEALRYE